MDQGIAEETRDGFSETAAFFRKKSVFITGAAGFVGSVLLEILLRCCPAIETIYILLRANQHGSAKHRRERIFKKDIFQKLCQENPDVFQKVKAVEGDVTSDNLGLCEADLEEILRNVSIVFHCAAILNFAKPLRYMLIQNLLGTQNVIDVCKKMDKLEVLAYASTAMSQCNQGDAEILEIAYEMKVPASQFLKALKAFAGDDALADLQKQCTPKWPNTYVFTKALAEDLLKENASEIPIAIVRPSMIISAWKGCLPGYMESGSALIDICLAVGKGHVKTVHLDSSKKCGLIPVDVVANTLICAAKEVGCMKEKSCFFVNCCTSGLNPITWGKLHEILFDMCKAHPLPNSFQSPSIAICDNTFLYKINALMNHYVPAVVFDFFLMLKGKKPIVTKLYLTFDKSQKHFDFGRNYSWNFSCVNFEKLIDSQSAVDSKLFQMDVRNLSFVNLFNAIPSGASSFKWETDNRGKAERLALMKKRAAFTNFLWYLAFTLLVMSVYFPMKKIFELF